MTEEKIGIKWQTSDGEVMLTPTKLIITRNHIPVEPKNLDILVKPRTEIPLETLKMLAVADPKEKGVSELRKKIQAGFGSPVIILMGINPQGKEAMCPISIHRRFLEPVVLTAQIVKTFIETVQKEMTNRNLSIINEKKTSEEWICLYCQTLNPATQIDCFHCNAPRKDKQ